MAFPNLSEIVTTTLRSRTGELADNMSRNNAALLRLSKRGNVKTFSGGRTIVQELNYADNQTYQWYSGYQTLNIAPSQVFSAAEYPIRQAAVAVSISGLEELQNSGEEAIIDLLESRIMNAEDTFMNGLSQGIYGDGTVTGSVGGLQLLVSSSPSSGVIGGIDRSQWTFWQNKNWSAATNGGVSLSAATIMQQMDALWVELIRGRDSPDLIIADNVSYRYYLSALQAIQRIQVENGAPDMAEAGFQTLKYMSADVVLDGGFQGFATDPLPAQTSGSTSAVGGAPSTTMYFLNTKYIHWRPHAQRNMVPLDPDRFSINQDAMVRLIGWAGNMTLSNAFLQGILTA
ncbi:MAG TPA: phage major capsid protein [Ktedonobacteraceae bacterium]|jgi:hypothetical protein|nr:phage major capsid protein [Ktedonobacteraceae bacterium]